MTIDKLSERESLVLYFRKEHFFSFPKCQWTCRKMRIVPLTARITRLILSVIVAGSMNVGDITRGYLCGVIKGTCYEI